MSPTPSPRNNKTVTQGKTVLACSILLTLFGVGSVVVALLGLRDAGRSGGFGAMMAGAAALDIFVFALLVFGAGCVGMIAGYVLIRFDRRRREASSRARDRGDFSPAATAFERSLTRRETESATNGNKKPGPS
jgi:hypothetical protein